MESDLCEPTMFVELMRTANALFTTTVAGRALEEAKRCWAKSLRCGGCSEAAAQGVREGVTQGHGGWLSRTSLIHYDLMKKSEATLTSRGLPAADSSTHPARAKPRLE